MLGGKKVCVFLTGSQIYDLLIISLADCLPPWPTPTPFLKAQDSEEADDVNFMHPITGTPIKQVLRLAPTAISQGIANKLHNLSPHVTSYDGLFHLSSMRYK